jgi:hypothetical protein
VESLVWLSVPAVALLGAAFRRRRADVVDLEPMPPVKALPRISAKPGSAEYYRQRLARDFPHLASAVKRGEMSVFGASVAAGLRKPARGQAGLSLPAPREALLLGKAVT